MYRRISCPCGSSYSSNALARASHLRGEKHFLGAYWRDFSYQWERNLWWKAHSRPELLSDSEVETLVNHAKVLAHAARRAGR